MVRGKGTGYILGPAEMDGLVQEKQELQQALKEAESGEYGKGGKVSIDIANLKRQIAQIDAAIAQGEAPRIGGLKKDGLVKEAADILARIKIGLPTRFEMDFPTKAPGAVGKHLKWVARTEKDIHRYREIMKTLEPEDPTATDIEKFRLEK